MEGFSEVWVVGVTLGLLFSGWFCQGLSSLRMAFGSFGSGGWSRVVGGGVSEWACGFFGFSGELRIAMVVLVGLFLVDFLVDFLTGESIAASDSELICSETAGNSR